jgi:DNA-directed RNA polymerase sigma subunit (sigma70/sigma32)
VLATLPLPERYVLEHRLDPRAPSFANIGADMRLTRQRVAQLEASALRRLGASVPSLAAFHDQRAIRPCVSRGAAEMEGLHIEQE